MKFLKVNPDNSIADVVSTNEPGTIQIEDDYYIASGIPNNKYGHVVFDFINGEIVLNSARVDAVDLVFEKTAFENKLIQQELIDMAKERLAPVLTSIRNAQDKNTLNILKGQYK